MSPITLRRSALASCVVGSVSLLAVALPAAAEGTAADCVTAGNVWVHVEYDDTVTGACATEFATGTEALVSTGLAADQGVFYTTIDGVTSEDPEWWSLWTAPVVDGQLGEWTFSEVGAGDLKPEAGQVIGWRLLPDYNKPQEAPAHDPLAQQEPAASPEATAAGSTSAAPSADASPSSSAAPADNAEDADTGTPTGTIVGVAAVALLAALGGLIWWRRRGQ